LELAADEGGKPGREGMKERGNEGVRLWREGMKE
jgi:hypothetical protein